MSEPLENLYFNWLCGRVIRLENPTPSLKYDRLLRFLHNTEFVWLLPGDDDRAEDGVELRRDFLAEAGLPNEPDWEHLPCSVLEMLVAFSKRCEFATDVAHDQWFWEFIENLDLKEFTDAEVLDEIRVAEILYIFVWRQYDYCGNGGIMPLESSQHDQTKVEMWYQFCDYLVDKNRMP